MLLTCFSTAPSLTTSARAMRGVRAALRHQREHAPLTRGQPVEWILSAGAGQQLAHDLRVEHGAPGADVAHRVDELAHVGHPILQEVAHAADAATDELARVALLDVLGEQEDADLRPTLPGSRSPARTPSSVCVGGMRTSSTTRSGCVGSSAASSEAASPKLASTSSPASTSSRVMPSRRRTESSASITRTGAAPAGSSGRRMGSSTLQRAADRCDPVAQPREPGSRADVGASRAVVADLDHHANRRPAPARPRRSWRREWRATFVSASDTTK